MVWSACVISPTKEHAEAAAQNAANPQFVLRRVRLPCPYRVQMRVTNRMLRYGSERIPERRPFVSADTTMVAPISPEKSTLPPLPPRRDSPTSRGTFIRSTGTAQSDVAFVQRVIEHNKTRLLLAIKDLQQRQSERLAAEQMARQQLDIRAGERRMTDRTIGYRVKGHLSQWDKEVELDNFEPMIRYLDIAAGGGVHWLNGEEVIDEEGNVFFNRLSSSQYRIRERMWRADQKARTRHFWSDRMNQWITVRERGDSNQNHVFWSFVHGKKLFDWNPRADRYHDCTCKGHCSHHGGGKEICPCKICQERWEAFQEFLRKMKDRLKLLREGKLSKEEMRLARIEEANKLREYLAAMAEADRIRKLAEAKAKRLLRSEQRPKRHENTGYSTIRAGDVDDDEDEYAAWNESSDEELMDIARDGGDDDDVYNRPELDFHDKMYESNVDDDFQFIPLSTSPLEKVISPVISVPEPPSPSPTPPPPPPPLPKIEKKAAKVSFKLPKKKAKPAAKKRKSKQLPTPPPVTPTPVEEVVAKPITPLPPISREASTPPTPPTPVSPPPPLPASSFGQRSFMIEEADDDEPKKRRQPKLDTVEDDYDFVMAEEQPPATPQEPVKQKLARPENWGQPSKLADELSFRPSKSATKRRALDKAIAERQKAARGRKPKKAIKEGEEQQEEEEEPYDPDWLDQFYYIQDKSIASRCRYAFQAHDQQNTGRLDLEQTLQTLCRINPALSEQETFYIQRIFELFGVNMLRGIDLRLFTIMGAFSLRLTALDEWVRTMVNEIDFRLLEYKLHACKRLWLTCSDDANRMSEDQFRVLLITGGVTIDHERSACAKLFANRPEPHSLDMLDFLAYIPLFIAIHMRIVAVPMDETRTR